MTYRETGKIALSSVLTIQKNIDNFEKYIYLESKRLDEHEQEEVYTRIVYQTIGDILSGKKLAIILSLIKNGKIGWKHPAFDSVTLKQAEQDEFIINPFEVEDGVLECHCGSKRVFSYSKQCRSSDEPTTTFAECMSCKARWTDNA